ncbi:SURF1 family protein [Gordonia paraffinivorans]|uniref:SURF1 family cytochrome oxidase biogenesis protein n=1 Tax=Gordonia paraffinivorans TaxID=175628 RepID=UPI00242E5983|nr:SURF1 family cytochrome oxidase biogenesis protein [Gordonia paraffinivorans]
MHVLRTILRPGWIALGIVVVAFAVACFTLLAPWQLGKNTDTERRNDLIRTATSLETAPIDDVAPGSAFDPGTEWREVSVTGRYLEDRQALVRLRNVKERPAIEVLTPFAVSGSDRVVLVNRGFVRPTEGAVPDIPPPPAGEVTIAGRIRAAESVSNDRGAGDQDGVLTVPSINPGLVGGATGTKLDEFYLQLSKDQPGALGEIELPHLDSGPYLSYGLQWLAFGIMAPLGVGYFLWAEIKARRRAAEAAAPESSEPRSGGTAEQTAGAESPDEAHAAAAVVRTPTPTKGAPESRAERKRRMREELRAAAGASVTPQVGQIGQGPTSEESASDKLSRRYGG